MGTNCAIKCGDVIVKCDRWHVFDIEFKDGETVSTPDAIKRLKELVDLYAICQVEERRLYGMAWTKRAARFVESVDVPEVTFFSEHSFPTWWFGDGDPPEGQAFPLQWVDLLGWERQQMQDMLTMGGGLAVRDTIPEAPFAEDWPRLTFETGEILRQAVIRVAKIGIGPLKPKQSQHIRTTLTRRMGDFLKEAGLPWDAVSLEHAKPQKVYEDSNRPHWAQVATLKVAQPFRLEVPPLEHEWWAPFRKTLKEVYGE
jgi:hypothetical protein